MYGLFTMTTQQITPKRGIVKQVSTFYLIIILENMHFLIICDTNVWFYLINVKFVKFKIVTLMLGWHDVFNAYGIY